MHNFNYNIFDVIVQVHLPTFRHFPYYAVSNHHYKNMPSIECSKYVVIIIYTFKVILILSYNGKQTFQYNTKIVARICKRTKVSIKM